MPKLALIIEVVGKSKFGHLENLVKIDQLSYKTGYYT